jgi:hypothetical protein
VTAGQGRALTWIENNLWAILCAMATGGAGILIGTTTTNHRLEVLEAKVAIMEKRQDDFGQRQSSAIRNLDRINDRMGITPPQPLEMQE